MTMEEKDLTTLRFDIAFDNDLITWVEDDGIDDNDETSHRLESRKLTSS